jgi:predicted MFS family arabinose efflux permease
VTRSASISVGRSGATPGGGSQRPLIPVYLLMLLFNLGEGALRFLVPIHLDRHGASLMGIGAVTSAFGVATLVARLPAGALYRPATLRRSLVAAGTASAGAFFLVGFTARLDLILLLMVVDGIGWGVATTLLLTVILGSRGRGVSPSATMGWYVGFQGVGHALAGVTGGLLGDALGLRGAFTALAGLLLAATVGIAWIVPRIVDPSTARGSRRSWSASLITARGLSLAVWIAALAGLYLNIMNSILNTFFPLLALSLGMTLSQAGLLVGLRSGVSAVARFASIPLFERFRSGVLRLPLLVVSGVTTTLVGVTTTFGAHVPLWMSNGASRGLIRVGTSADAMASLSDGDEGLAAALMSTGLDLGKVLGPLLGGAVAQRYGTPAAFYVVPAAFLGVYSVLELVEQRRRRLQEPDIVGA